MNPEDLEKLALEVIAIAKEGGLPDGDCVQVSVLLWAEGWWAKLKPDECPYAYKRD